MCLTLLPLSEDFVKFIPKAAYPCYVFFYITVSQCGSSSQTRAALNRFFLGTFANLRKAAISYVMSDVRPSVLPLGTTRLSLDEFS